MSYMKKKKIEFDTHLFFTLKLQFNLLAKYWQQNFTTFGHFKQFRINQFLDTNHFRLCQTAGSNVR